MIFRITQKLATKIKATPAAALPPHLIPLFDWTANLFMVSRWQYIILTNTHSMYSVVFTGKDIRNETAFIEHGLSALRENLYLDGIPDVFVTNSANELSIASFCKAGDRSVQGSMNQLVFQAKWDLVEKGYPLPIVNHGLNRTVLSRLKYRYAVEEFAALADQWQV